MISEDYKQRLLESIEKIGVSYAEHKLLKDEIRRLHNREEKYKEFMFQDQEQKLENINRMYNKVELKEHQEECLSRACACRGFSETDGYAPPKIECGYHASMRKELAAERAKPKAEVDD